MEPLLRIGLGNALAATGLALIAAAVGRVCRRPALVRALWLLVLLKLLMPPLISLPVSWPTASAPATEATSQPEVTEPVVVVRTDPLPALEPAPRAQTGPADLAPVEAAPSDVRPAPSPVAADPLPASAVVEPADSLVSQSVPPAEPWALPSWPTIMGAGWLAGSAGWMAVAVWRVARFRRVLRHAEPASGAVAEQARRLAAVMGLSRCPGVWFVSGSLTPLLWALGGPPRLLVPAALWARLTPLQRDTLLAHELAHLRRGDHWARWLELAALALYWWHPVVWWARNAIQEAEETCCDAWVVWALPAAARDYALTLIETVAFLSQDRPALPLAASGIGPVSRLKRRLTMILQGPKSRGLSRAGWLMVLVVGVLLLPLLPTYGKPDDGPRSDDPPAGSSTGAPPAGEKAPALEPTRNSDPRPIERPAPPLGMSSREIEDLRDLVELLQIQLEAKRAEYQEAEVTLKQAAQSRSRIAGLNKAAAVSAEEVQNAENQVQIQEARLVVKRATVREAEVRLAQARRRLERVAPPDSRSPGQRPQPTAKGRGPDPRAGSEKPAVASPDANAAYEKRLADLDAKIQALLEETRALRGHKPAAPPTKDPGLEEVRAYQFGVGEGPLAFLPDGKSFLRGMRGGLLQWDVATGRILRGLDAPLGAKGDVTAVAVSPDGKVFVSAKRASDGDGSSVTLWDAATGKVLARYFRAGADFPCLAVSPDGKLLALGDSELGALRLLDIPTGKVKQDRDVGNGIRAVAFSPDGRRVACGGVEGRIYIGDVQTGARVLNIATASHLTSLAYSPDGKLILTGDDQGALLLWDADSGNPVRQIKGPVAAVVQARFLPDGRTIFSAAGDRLSLWDAATGQELVQSRKARDGGSDAGRFQAIALSPDGRQALTNENGTLRLWEVRSGRFDRRAEGH